MQAFEAKERIYSTQLQNQAAKLMHQETKVIKYPNGN
jgi:hypothetical protein